MCLLMLMLPRLHHMLNAAVIVTFDSAKAVHFGVTQLRVNVSLQDNSCIVIGGHLDALV